MLVAGKFKEAGVTIKEAGKEMVDVVTGVDDSTTKIAETFNEVTEAVVDYAKETYEAAESNIELTKAAELAEVQVQGLIEKYDQQAEVQRKIRDDETKTFKDRIEANEKLGVILEKQRKEMLALRQTELDRAQVEYNKLKNQENLIALTEAQNELAAVNAQIEGFTSEQVQNRISLERELLDTKRELELESVDIRERELLEVEHQYDELFRLAKNAGEDTVALEEQKAKAISEIRRQQAMADLQVASDSLENVKQLLGEETEAGKAAAVAQSTINTYQGVSEALGSAPPPLNFILAATTLAAGLQNITKILSVQEPQFAQVV